ncbi:MAG: hypothetical protein KatS3mg014_0403 [Actinomycetota bacterium]|nr:MAG: hypothetical protein KatS3mg014_0403 [Actinomycetota bacterium]
MRDVETHILRSTATELATPDTDEAARTRRLWGLLAAISLTVLLAMAFWYAPEDANQGPVQRIFYIHVPSAWIGFLAFAVVFVASIAFLATGARRFDELAASSAEVGIVFTTAVLITGPLWGRPIWGIYWTWDPRLTSFLMLWLIYLSYLVLRGYVPEPIRRARFSAVLGIVGFLDVPIVYLSARVVAVRASHAVRRGGRRPAAADARHHDRRRRRLHLPLPVPALGAPAGGPPARRGRARGGGPMKANVPYLVAAYVGIAALYGGYLVRPAPARAAPAGEGPWFSSVTSRSWSRSSPRATPSSWASPAPAGGARKPSGARRAG